MSDQKIILFCIPFAGGTASNYESWIESGEENDLKVVPIELAGKGKRNREEQYKSMEEAAQDVFQIIKENIADTDYAIFGHSMGSIIAYEVCKKIEKEQVKKPIHLFCSGRQALHIKNLINYSSLNDRDLKEHVKNFEFLNKEQKNLYRILGLYIEKIRNDFRIVDEYVCTEQKRLTIPTTVCCGKEDNFDISLLSEWERYTQCFDMHIFDGGHFYFNNCHKQLLEFIREKIDSCIER